MAKLLYKDGVRIGGGGVRIDTEGVVRHESDTINPIGRIDGGTYDDVTDTLDIVGPGETGGGESIHIGAAILFPGFTVTSVLGMNNGVDIDDAGGSFSAQVGVVVGAKLQFSTGTGEVDATIHLIRPGVFNGQAFTRIFFLTTHTGIVAGDTISLHQNIVTEIDAGDGIIIDPDVPNGVATIENEWGSIPTDNRFDGAVLKTAGTGTTLNWGSAFSRIRILGDVPNINLIPGDLFVSGGGLYQYNPNASVSTIVTVGDDLSVFLGPFLEDFVLADNAEAIKTIYESNADTNAFTDNDQVIVSGWGTAPTGTKPNDISWNEVVSPVVHNSVTGVLNAGSGPLGSGFSHPAANAAASLLFTLPDGDRDVVRDQFFIPKIRAIGPLVDGMTNARVIDRTEDVGANQLRVFFEGELTVLASDDANDAANIEIFTVASQTIHTIEGGTYDNGILVLTDETGFSSESQALFARVDGFGTFQSPALLPIAITPYDRTTHLVLGTVAYYIHYRNVLGSTAATLTTVADTDTIIFTYNIN